MDRSYPYSRRLVSRARLRKRMVAVFATGLLGTTALFMMTWKPDPIAASVGSPVLPLLALNDALDAGAPGQPGRPAARRIYPYSVVPGGVSSQAELKRVIRTDSVVAAHYATFDVDKASAVVVDKPRAVHVSYRKGDKVYWTARKVMLAPGETLLSDGSNEMRARCANRISDLPQYPVEAHQPAMEELDQAVELAEGEAYALGADGLPVSMSNERGAVRLPGQRFTVYAASGSSGSAQSGVAAGTTLAASSSSGSNAPGPITTMGFSGSSSSMGSRPSPTGRPAPETPTTQPTTSPPTSPDTTPDTPAGGMPVNGSGTESGGGTTTAPAPAPSAETLTSAPQPGTGTQLPPTESVVPPGSPVGEPRPTPAPAPGGTPLPDTPTTPALPTSPAPQPPGQQSGGGKSDELPQTEPSQPSGTETVPPKPGPGPGTDLPPTGIEQPAPAEVPEPASLWLFGAALAALVLLRRQRRA